MKVMISQPMNGIPDDEIRRIRLELTEKFANMHIEVVDSYFTEEAPYDTYHPNVYYLGRTIMQAMCNIDAVYFAKGWNNARGCRIERAICEEYGIKILDDSFFSNKANILDKPIMIFKEPNRPLVKEDPYRVTI